MILGILSDTHGQHERARRALALLVRQGAQAIVHCGDIGGEDVLDELAAAARELRGGAPAGPGPVWFVWGNTDEVGQSIVRYAQSLGLSPPEVVPLRLTFDGRRFAVFHGHEEAFAGFDPAQADYILHGHTHVPRDEPIGQTRIINPGALHRAARHTVATLDLDTCELRLHTVGG